MGINRLNRLSNGDSPDREGDGRMMAYVHSRGRLSGLQQTMGLGVGNELGLLTSELGAASGMMASSSPAGGNILAMSMWDSEER